MQRHRTGLRSITACELTPQDSEPAKNSCMPGKDRLRGCMSPEVRPAPENASVPPEPHETRSFPSTRPRDSTFQKHTGRTRPQPSPRLLRRKTRDPGDAQAASDSPPSWPGRRAQTIYPRRSLPLFPTCLLSSCQRKPLDSRRSALLFPRKTARPRAKKALSPSFILFLNLTTLLDMTPCSIRRATPTVFRSNPCYGCRKK